MSKAKLILIRGLPGSGKTTLAKQLASKLDAKHFEADMYFENAQGDYLFDQNKLGDAHDWCFCQTKKWLKRSHIVIVSNTFVRHWEMKRYLQYCKKHHVEFEIKVCGGTFKSIHNVPSEVIEKMREKWQP